jgi:hypothetical protein
MKKQAKKSKPKKADPKQDRSPRPFPVGPFMDALPKEVIIETTTWRWIY